MRQYWRRGGASLIPLALAAGVVLAFAGPASAKGVAKATVTGPGLAAPIRLVEGDAGDLFPGGVGISNRPATVSLGPRYTVRMTIAFDPAQPSTHVISYLYPYGRDEAGRVLWMYTPPGQRYPEGTPISPGWKVVDVFGTTLLPVLEAHGLPRRPPVPVPPPTTRGPATPAVAAAPAQRSTSPGATPSAPGDASTANAPVPIRWAWFAGGIAALMVLVIAGVAAGRGRSPRASAAQAPM